MHKCLIFTVEEEIYLLYFNTIRNNDKTFSTFVYEKEYFTPNYIFWNSFCPTKQKLRIFKCITSRYIKICMANCLEKDSIV